ncbi:MAG: hypothetical protein Q9216_002692 [Gyalolechia sp. 2 TL-2023]
MADYDRGDEREVRESPFQTLTKHIAGLKIQNGDSQSSEVEDDKPKVVETIESLCMSCEENGETRLLLTKIPYFREIILMSFSCPYCGFSNTEVQSAGQIQERGTKYIVKVTGLDDMERQIIKSDTALFRLEDLDIEMPAGHGQLTNIEGMLNVILRDLEAGQRQRKKEELELWKKIDAIVQSLLRMTLNQSFPFTVALDDPSGNSWIEPSSTDKDSKYQKVEYPRTAEQNEALGLAEATNGQKTTDESPPPSTNGPTAHVVPQIPSTTSPSDDDTTTLEDVDILAGQNYSLPTACPGCTHPAHLNLQLLKIPYFKEVVVSAVMCQHCNYRSSDVKTGGEVPAKGKRIFLDVREPEDLRRDILKSETCCVKIEEIGVEVSPGTMGGRFTTVEGLLTQIRDDLKSTVFDVGDKEEGEEGGGGGGGGDSMPEDKQKAWKVFFGKMEEAIRGELRYTILLEDPLANSYVQNFLAPDPDPKIREEEYARSEEVDEELGISDMRTRMGAGGEYEKEGVQAGDAVAGGNAVANGKEVEAERARAAGLVS